VNFLAAHKILGAPVGPCCWTDRRADLEFAATATCNHLSKLLVIFRIQFCGHRRQRAEQTIGIPIDARREE